MAPGFDEFMLIGSSKNTDYKIAIVASTSRSVLEVHFVLENTVHVTLLPEGFTDDVQCPVIFSHSILIL